jgi:hypothetical protein
VKELDNAGGSGAVLNLCFHGIGAPGRALEPDEELYWLNYDRFVEYWILYLSVLMFVLRLTTATHRTWRWRSRLC